MNKTDVKASILPKDDKFLGDYCTCYQFFENIDRVFEEFYTDGFKSLNEIQRSERVNRTLLHLINAVKQDSFLLPAVISYIDRVHSEKILDNAYHFSHFEFWLNQFSGLTEEENYLVRAKIVGKRIPREEYQALFPIGMGKKYPGSHFVSAHTSPDLDTTIASFWGWIDAFGARVGEGLHIWNLPGGRPSEQIMIGLKDIFGEALFSHVASSRTALTLSGFDFITQKGFIKKHGHELTTAIDHGRDQKAIILVDETGAYLGDWRNTDVEGVRQVILLLNNCLRWFESNLYVKLISLFAKEDLSHEDIPSFITSALGLRIKDCEPAKDYNEEQRGYLDAFLSKVLGVAKGIESTFGEFGVAMDKLSVSVFLYFTSMLESLGAPELFDHAGYLKENRPTIFLRLERVIKTLDEAIQNIRNYMDRLDIAIKIKYGVLGYQAEYVTMEEDIEEIRIKMESHHYLTVVYNDKEGVRIPLGIIISNDLHKQTLGTVSLRDFCNRDEIKIAPYLEVISVIDHHRSGMQTSGVPVVITGDVQSCNVLLAEQAFHINDRYSMGGMSHQDIETQLGQHANGPFLSDLHITQKLIKRRFASQSTYQSFIHPQREFAEYLCFLHAILDDTDLLAKVSHRDVNCVATLLNRLKSLMLGKEVELISLDDLPKDAHFAKAAAKRLLQNRDLYSIYSQSFKAKESEVQRNIELSGKGMASDFFADTKAQNGCCRVGQTKLFPRNFPQFIENASAIREMWLRDAKRAASENPNLELHIHMISTIAGAQEVYQDNASEYPHQDEIWLWNASTSSGDRLVSYLNAFKLAPEVVNNQMEVEFTGGNASELAEIFDKYFLDIPQKLTEDSLGNKRLPIAILRFKAGTLNSRKSMITPYLPSDRKV